MLAIDLRHSAAFRWGIAVALALAVQAAVLFGFFWWETVAQSVAAVDRELVSDCRRIGALEVAEQYDVIEDRLHGDFHRNRFAGLFGPSGDVLTGNIAAIPSGLASDGAAHATPILRSDVPGRVAPFTRTVACPAEGGGTLLLAQDADSLEDYRALVGRAVGLGAIPAVLIALATGALLGSRAQAHVRRVRHATERVMSGQLGERLPVRGTKDDLDLLSADVNRMLDRLSELVEQVRHVGNDIAHDLRTPLTRLRAGLERGFEDAATPEQFQAVGEQAMAEVDRALAIIAALLRVTELEQARRRSAFAAVEPAALLRDVADLYGPVAEERGVSLRLDLAAGQSLHGDRDLLMEASANLVDNAVKFSPPGGTVWLRLSAGAGGAAVIEVADSGPGIPPGEREAVFRRFHRADQSRGVGGNGLGLALVRAIAELHGVVVEIADAAPGCIVRLRFLAPGRMQRIGELF